MDPSYLTTIGGWAAILTIGGYIYYQSQQKTRKPAAGKASAQSGKQATDYEKNVASAATATKKKAEKALKPKSKPAASTTTDTPAATSTAKYDPEAEAAADKALNNEFARQYATAKSGTKFEAAKKDEKRQKSIKQSRAREIDAAQAQAQAKTSAPSSTTGDADDDLSEANSPVVPAADSRDVSDMLEQTAPGPSVLRLTDTDAVKQKQKKEKKLEVVETKKQRQNRKKAEAAKAQRAQDELERKKLEEAQRRQSRIAEGRAAKDGSAFMAANQNNAWNPKPTNGDASATVQPLDTYEEKPAAAAPKSVAAAPAAAAAAPAKQTSGTWMSSMPSEEEQLKMIQDEEAWNEVTSKKKKSKQPVADSPAVSTPAENGVSTSASAAAPKAAVNGKQSKPLLTSNSSFAALTPDETANDESEVEEEWEV